MLGPIHLEHIGLHDSNYDWPAVNLSCNDLSVITLDGFLILNEVEIRWVNPIDDGDNSSITSPLFYTSSSEFFEKFIF